MALRYSTATKNESLINGIDAIFDADGRIAFFSGAQPATGDSAGTGLLATLALSADAMAAAASGGELNFNAITSANASASGNAASFIIYKNGQTVPTTAAVSGTDHRINGTVGTSGADINFDSVALASGAPVNVTSLKIVHGG